jgi:hypothetical protein
VKAIDMMRDKMIVEGDKGGLVLKGKTVRFQVRANRTVFFFFFLVKFFFFYLIRFFSSSFLIRRSWDMAARVATTLQLQLKKKKPIENS